jgi:hypothetical protein
MSENNININCIKNNNNNYKSNEDIKIYSNYNSNNIINKCAKLKDRTQKLLKKLIDFIENK